MYRSIVIAAALLWPCLAAAVPPAVKINELLPNPDSVGGDPGWEWVEFYNADSVPVDIGGWKLQRKSSGTTWGTRFTFPTDGSATIPVGGYLVLADDETNVPGADFYKGTALNPATLDLNNGTKGDGVRLVDGSDEIADVVVYGPNNDDGIEDETGSAATSVAPNPTEGFSLARSPNGTDTNQGGEDFILTASHTRGSANPDPPVCDVASGVVINEFYPDHPSGDTGFEYVELYNGAGRRVSLEGWKIEAGTTSFSTKVVLGAVDLEAGEFLVIGEDQVSARDVTASLALPNATSTADGVRLVHCDAGAPNPVVDTVIYGTPNSDGLVDDSGVAATSLAPKPTAGEALARRLDGADSNLSGVDFVSQSTLTPGTPNPAPPVCEHTGGWVVINEALPNPAGTDSGNEWVELYNAHGSDTISLEGWTLRVSTSGSWSIKTTFDGGATVGPGGFLLVGEAAVTGSDVTSTLSMGNGTGGDGVQLVDCAGNVADTLVYGADNEDEIVDDSGGVAQSLAPPPSDGASLARKLDGVDTDRCGDDFTVTTSPTPGGTNPVLVCVASTGTVVINEILPDPEGTDSQAASEWVELYNRGSAAVALDGWTLVTANNGEDQAIDVQIPPASSIRAAGFFVVGNANVGEADYQTVFSMGNGTDGDGVLLLDCDGTVVDAVAYGSGDNEDLVVDEQGLVADLAPNPGSNQSLARKDDGVDTNDVEDWFLDVSPTPGTTNFQDLPDLPDEEGGCGRRGQAPGGDAPSGCGNSDAAPGDSGCTTLPLPFGGWELIPLLVALRRRRGPEVG